MLEVASKFGPECITVCIDFDERVIRMGFGDLAAVKALRDAGIAVITTPGLRTGLVIVDHLGYIFTPTALYLEADHRAAEAPNAMRLRRNRPHDHVDRSAYEPMGARRDQAKDRRVFRFDAVAHYSC